MYRYFFSFLGFITIIFLTGCGASQTPLATPTMPIEASPVTNSSWQVSLHQSGGIAGISRSIVVTSDGNYVATDLRTQVKITGQLPDDTLSQLTGLLSSSKYTPPTAPDSCADCFIYDLEITSNSQNLSVQLDDISLPHSGMEPLVDLLSNQMKSALEGNH